MDEDRIRELMSLLDHDLVLQELNEVMDDIDIDADSISQKVHWKLQKGNNTMNKRKSKVKAIVIIAASLVLACGGIAIYASEISAFLQSLMGKTTVYGTTVDGQAYYLEEPLALDNGNRLTQAMFDKKELGIQIELASGDRPDIKIRVGGIEMEPHGMEGQNLFFYDLEPTNQFDLVLDGKSYPVQLSSSKSVVDGNEIFQGMSESVPWISMGYKKIEGGIQLLGTVDDPSIKIVFYEAPSKDTIKAKSNNQGISSSNRAAFLPILGYDQAGNAYEFHKNTNDMGRPLTKYTTDAPVGEKLTVTLPSIVVASEKSLHLKVDIPSKNEKQAIPQTLDLGLQKMQLDSIERTSDTTARLHFTLNTGEQKNIRIWEAFLDSPTAEAMESLWENGACDLDVTFPSGTSSLELLIASPTFIIDGNWILKIQ